MRTVNDICVYVTTISQRGADVANMRLPCEAVSVYERPWSAFGVGGKETCLFFWVCMLCWWARDAPVYDQKKKEIKKKYSHTHSEWKKESLKRGAFPVGARFISLEINNFTNFHGPNEFPFWLVTKFQCNKLIYPSILLDSVCAAVIHAIIMLR